MIPIKLSMSLLMLSATPGYCKNHSLKQEHVEHSKYEFSTYLYFHGHRTAILEHCSVHLSDGRSCERFFVESLQLIAPVGAELLRQDCLQHNRGVSRCNHWLVCHHCKTNVHLPCRHEVGTLSNALEDLLHFGTDEAVVCKRAKEGVEKTPHLLNDQAVTRQRVSYLEY